MNPNPKELIRLDDGRQLDYDSFKKLVLDDPSADSLKAEIGGFGLRAFSHFASKLDPTGMAEFFFKEAEHAESQDRENRLIRTMFLLFQGLVELKHNQKKVQGDRSTTPSLVETYARYSVQDPAPDKIEYFRNLLCNGLSAADPDPDSLRFYLDLARELSLQQVRILVFYYEHGNKPIPPKSPGVIQIADIRLPRDPPPPVSIQEIATALNLTIDQTILLVANLMGKGLLVRPPRFDNGAWVPNTQVELAEAAKPFLRNMVSLVPD